MDMADRLNPRGELLCYGPDVAFRRTTALPYGDRQAGLSGLENGKWQNVLWMVRQSARFCHAFTLFGSGFPLWSNVLGNPEHARPPWEAGEALRRVMWFVVDTAVEINRRIAQRICAPTGGAKLLWESGSRRRRVSSLMQTPFLRSKLHSSPPQLVQMAHSGHPTITPANS